MLEFTILKDNLQSDTTTMTGRKLQVSSLLQAEDVQILWVQCPETLAFTILKDNSQAGVTKTG